MSLWRQLTHGLRRLTNRASADEAVDDEVRDYFEQAADLWTSRGLSPEEARRAARLELGSQASVAEEVRAYGWENIVGGVAADARYAARRLRASPGFTAITILTLALGIGGTTTIFSAVNPILFQPLPYPDADRITTIWEAGRDGSRNSGTFGMYVALQERNRSFGELAVLKAWQPTLTAPDQPERFDAQRVSARYFDVLGISPALGRNFERSDDLVNAPNVVILSHALWRRRFAANPSVVGTEVRLDDTIYTVIGVMPRAFENVVAPSAELWTPLKYDMSQGRAWGHHLRTIGRLRADVTADQATREINGLGQAVLQELHPATYGSEVAFIATSLQDDVTRGVRPALLAILGAMMLVLVMSSVNVTNLLLARGMRRGGEFALRAALGAGHGRLIRQLFTESLLLAGIGGAAGMAASILGVRALVALAPPGLPRIDAIAVDGTVLAFGLGITTIIGLAFGLIPALQAATNDPQHGLHHASPRTQGGHRRTRGALVVAEVALALVLLVGSGLLLRSLGRLFAVPVGFEASGLLTMQVQTAGHRFDEAGATARFFSEALEAVERVPGVTAAGLTSQLPLSGDLDEYGVHFESNPRQGDSVFRYGVSPAYLSTMGIPLRSGRLLGEQDRAGAPLVALVSVSLAKRRFPAQSPIGQRLRIGPADGALYTIVGVVGDVRQVSLALSQSDAVYTTVSQWPRADTAMSLVVRGHGEPAGLAAAVRQAVWSVDKDQPVVRVATMDALLATSAAERRFALILFEAFALAALGLAAAGIYGVLSGSVEERTREIGVRAALGASRGDILMLITGQGLTLTLGGVAIGLLAAVASSQAIGTLLFGVSRLDPLTYSGVVALLLAVSALACWVPAWRAARVDPAITLRAE
jgi:putative ABC transport system permease protein